jgi:hypothetical protein
MSDTNLPGTDETVFETPFKGRRRRLMTLGVLLAAALGAYAGWWFWLAAEVRGHVDGWVAAMRDAGRNAGYATMSVSGFPGLLKIDIDGIDIADAGAGWSVHLPRLNAEMAPWRITSLQGAFTGPLQVLQTKGGFAGRYRVTAAANGFSVSQEKGGRLRAQFEDVRASHEETGRTLGIGALSLGLRRGSLPVYGQLVVDARDADLPPDLHSAFGGHVAHFRMTAEASGAVPPTGITPAALGVWTRDGGALDIRALEIAHGVLGLKGEGTLALDQNLQPIGAFTARISGFNAAVDTLVDAGIARREDGALAKIVLGVLAKSPPGGGPKEVSLPLTLQDRQLSVGPIALIRLREIHWD